MKVSQPVEGTCLRDPSFQKPENMQHGLETRKQLENAKVDTREGQKRTKWKESNRGVLQVKLEFEYDMLLHGIVLKALKYESRGMGSCPRSATISCTIGRSLFICKNKGIELEALPGPLQF